MLGLYFERQLSTYYIADYERVTRKHLPWIIILFITTLSIICTICFTFELIQWYYPVTFSYLCMCIGVLLFIKLYHTNMEKWTEVQNDHRRARHAYTLSLRFQLEENIRSLKLIKQGFSVLGFAGIADFILFGLSNCEFLRKLDDGYLSQLLCCLSFLFMSIIAMAVPIAALFSHPTYMKILQKTRFIGKLVKWYDVPSVDVIRTDDTSQYFANLSKQWNTTG
ncbi:unnamed protein product [Auanema sp. JU1783]|nr:unnamed protein product [Auanema sp. JU1783]